MSQPNQSNILDVVIDALEEMKAKDITTLPIGDISTIADTMVIATGTSNRQLKAMADNVAEQAKKHGVRPLGTEGKDTNEWILVDLGDIIVHLMLPATREYYDLETLWSDPTQRPDSHTSSQAQPTQD